MNVIPDLLAELRRLAEAAIPGPWTVAPRPWPRHVQVLAPDGVAVCRTEWFHEDENAAYIAAANPAVMLALLDEIERLREEAAHWHSECGRLGSLIRIHPAQSREART